MKKVFTTILAVIYLATTSGASISVHYCMGEFASIDLVKKDKCGKCGMQNTKGCCNDDVKVLKVQDSHQAVHYDVSFEPWFAIAPMQYKLAKPLLVPTAGLITNHNNSPPGSYGISLHILYRSFLI